jgi:hypothetical protein
MPACSDPDNNIERIAMRQYFFLGILVFGVIAGIIYYFWSVIAALYRDWMMGKDVGKIKAQSETLRQKRAEEAERRLDNGCEHVFGESLGGFPPNTCHKCGLEKDRPDGPCDHVWKASQEGIASSTCAKCGRRYVSPNVAM